MRHRWGRNHLNDACRQFRIFFKTNPSPHVYVVSHPVCTGKDHVLLELKRIKDVGGEGIMLRRPGSPCVAGRSSTLLKVKSFRDAEAVVVGHELGKGKFMGMTGSLRCKMACGKGFKVGTGFSDDERAHPPPLDP